MMEPRLSICIATRNRGSFIGQTLESIICQVTEQVEIIIVDGGSTDSTAEVIQKYQAIFPKLLYFRQDTNRGVDRDFAEAVGLARGDYCWLFSDDDLLKPGAIQAVLSAIASSYGLVIVNAEVRSADLSRLLEARRLPLNEDQVYDSAENQSLFADVANYLTFIGCVVIKRLLWNSRQKEKYFGSCFIHVGVIFQSPIPENTLVIAKPLVSVRYGNASWLDRYFEIWMFKWPGLIWSFASCADWAKLRVCPKEPWRKAKTLLLLRAKGTYTVDVYFRWLEPRLESGWSRIASKVIASCPGRIANFLAVIYSLLAARSDRQLVLVDLMNSPFLFWRLRKRRLQPSACETVAN